MQVKSKYYNDECPHVRVRFVGSPTEDGIDIGFTRDNGESFYMWMDDLSAAWLRDGLQESLTLPPRRFPLTEVAGDVQEPNTGQDLSSS